MAAGHAEIIFCTVEGVTEVRVRGPETRPSETVCPEGRWMAARLGLGVSLSRVALADLADGRDLVLGSVESGHIRWNGHRLPVPRFDQVEDFVARLARADVLAIDPVVADSVTEVEVGRLRTLQRRFRAVTGLTRLDFIQIERARRGAWLLGEGWSIADAAFEAGYFDQAHFTRAALRFLGRTPGQIVREKHLLSFLYKTQGVLPAQDGAQENDHATT